MAQTAPEMAGDSPRPLPRRGRPPTSKTPRPRFTPIDGLWMLLLAALSFGMVFWKDSHLSNIRACVIIALTVACIYLIGWRTRDRATGIIAALFLATSLPFLSPAGAGNAALLLTFLTLAALFAFAAGSSLAAVILAGAAALVRPDAALLGLLLAVLSLLQKRQRAVLGLGLFCAISIGGWAALIVLNHQKIPMPSLHFHTWLVAWMISSGTVFLTWFLLPFCGEFSETARRARWLPTFLWAIIYFAAGSFVIFGNRDAMLTPFIPLFSLLAAGGVSRLLPTLAGEFPIPALRYLVAVLAVLTLVGIRVRSEWPVPLQHSPIAPQRSITTTILVPPQALAPVPTKPVDTIKKSIPAKPKSTKPKNAKLEPKKVVKPHTAAKPRVPLYVLKNRRLVRRSKWAIQWDLTHPAH